MPTYADVQIAEQKEIEEARTRRRGLFPDSAQFMPDPKDRATAGLAFSGGGIRSATFNLGILQGLARYNLLERIDYISTVSGGGYIGSWLISWIRRSGLREVIGGLASSPPSPPPMIGPAVPPPPADRTYAEADPINFLRGYSNYLTPRLGVLSADVWAAAASYIRNLLLNLTILILALSAALLLPRIWEAICFEIAKHADVFSEGLLHWLVILVALIFVLAITFASWNIASHDFSGLVKNKHTKQKWVLLGIVVPLFVAAPLGSIALWIKAWSLCHLPWTDWALGGLLVYGLARAIGLALSEFWLWRRKLRPSKGWRALIEESFWVALWASVAGALGGVLVGWIAHRFSEWAPLDPSLAVPPVRAVAFLAFCGAPLLIGALLLTGVLHIGLMSISFSNEKREWWARMTGWLLIFFITCAGLFWLGIYAPLQVLLLSSTLKTTLTGGWLASTLGGLLAGKSGSTSGKSGDTTKLEILAKIAPYVFVFGLLVALSSGIHRIVTPRSGDASSSAGQSTKTEGITGELELTARDGAAITGKTLTELKLAYASKPASDAEAIKAIFWSEVQRVSEIKVWCFPAWAWLLALALLLGGAALTFSAFIDINEFSMHLLYRNRLVRCYLGASNKDREQQLFTGFDPKDDTLLKDFSVNGAAYGPSLQYTGPYPVLNCTLSITQGERLAWQERRGESFIFTPRFCGYEFQGQYAMDGCRIGHRRQENTKADGYQKTETYAYTNGGVYLGTALATSGAAVNPNMGFHTSPPLAFLLTVFNVRLGWWLGNPQHPKTRERSTPFFGLFYLLAELFSLTTDRSRYVNLSDGFHFENLGLYELVRRRCKYIIVGDAGADPQHSFDDLGNAIRKCRTDFGVEIDVDLRSMKLEKDEEFSAAHCVTGTIHYELVDPNLEPGVLVYFKPTLTENDPVDVQNYKTLHPAFPHQSTANQWFDESQFESYRQLGRISAETALTQVGNPEDLRTMPTSKVFESLAALL